MHVAGENVGNIVDYLKVVLLIFSNCDTIPTDTMSLLWNTLYSAEYENFAIFMSNIYLNHKMKKHEINYMEYVMLSEAEYHTLYRK